MELDDVFPSSNLSSSIQRDQLDGAGPQEGASREETKVGVACDSERRSLRARAAAAAFAIETINSDRGGAVIVKQTSESEVDRDSVPCT